jgi:hypothetical protein
VVEDRGKGIRSILQLSPPGDLPPPGRAKACAWFISGHTRFGMLSLAPLRHPRQKHCTSFSYPHLISQPHLRALNAARKYLSARMPAYLKDGVKGRAGRPTVAEAEQGINHHIVLRR